MPASVRASCHLRLVALAIAAFCGILVSAAGQTLQWSARYHGMAMTDDAACKAIVDSQGNVYVTGTSEIGYVTIKYDSTGKQLWLRTKACGPWLNPTTMAGIAADGSGNVYIAGVVVATNGNETFATVKYDSNGNELWTAVYDEAAGVSDEPISVAVDSAGNVIVAGASYSSTQAMPIGGMLVVKYSPSGALAWSRRYMTSPDSFIAPVGVAVCPSGSVSVTGFSFGTQYPDDITTVQYDANGNQLWVARFDGATHADDRPAAITCDTAGNTYVAGLSERATYSADYVTLNYSTAGTLVWSATYQGVAASGGEANAIVVDGSGNVYVTGESPDSPSGSSFATVKYSSSGSEVWSERYAGQPGKYNAANAIVLRPAGGVFVTGVFGRDNASADYGTVAYDANGNQKWAATYAGVAGGADTATSVAADSSGAAVVTGGSWGGATNKDYATVKYGPTGTQLWAIRYTGSSSGWDDPDAMVVDPFGNSYVTGDSQGNGDGVDFATIKVDPHGAITWVQRYHGPNNGYERASAIAVDNRGNVFVTGESTGAKTNATSWATIKYDAQGNQMWAQRFADSDSTANTPTSLAADAAGNCCVTGWTIDLSYVSSATTVKYDPSGNVLWTQRYYGAGSGAFGQRVVLDPAGDVYVVGAEYTADNSTLTTLLKYDAGGNLLWSRQYGESPTTVYPSGLAIDDAGNVLVSASAGYGTDANTYVTLEYDSDGNVLWTSHLQTGDPYDNPSAISSDRHGGAFVCGNLTNGDGTHSRALIRYDSAGNQMWVQTYESGPFIDGWAGDIAVDPAGNVYSAGHASGYSAIHTTVTLKYSPLGDLLWTASQDACTWGGGSTGLDAFGGVHVLDVHYGGATTSDDYEVLMYNGGGPVISGTVDLDGYLGGVGVVGALEVRSPGTTNALYHVAIALDASGHYGAAGIPAGTYDVAVKFPNWLRQVVHGVQVTASGATADFALLNGDATGDNRIGLSDISIVLLYFSTNGPPGEPGDLNWDGKVGISDISLILSNFGAKGDP